MARKRNTTAATTVEAKSDVELAADCIKRAVKAFNGTYTITSPSGEHRTFRIRTQPEDSNFAPGKRVVSLLIGPDNNSDFKGFGFADENGIHVWSRYRLSAVHVQYAALLWSLATEGEASRFYAKGARILLEGRCVRCNRKLTHPVSIVTGIGPECAKRCAGPLAAAEMELA